MSLRMVWAALALVAGWMAFLVLADTRAGVTGLVAIAGQGALAVAALIAYVLAMARTHRRPASLTQVDGRRVAWPSPALHSFAVGQLLTVGSIGGVVIPGWREGPELYDIVTMVVWLLVLVAALFVAGSVLRGGPRLELTEQALIVRDPLGRRRIPWQALSPAAPVRSVGVDRLALTISDKSQVERRGLPARSGSVHLGFVAVDPGALAQSIHDSVVQARVSG